MLETVKGNGCG